MSRVQAVAGAIATAETLEAGADFRSFAFALHQVIDCMVTFALRDQGSSVLYLVNLLFSVLLRCPACLTLALDLQLDESPAILWSMCVSLFVVYCVLCVCIYI